MNITNQVLYRVMHLPSKNLRRHNKNHPMNIVSKVSLLIQDIVKLWNKGQHAYFSHL